MYSILNYIPDHDLGRLSELSFYTYVKYYQENPWIDLCKTVEQGVYVYVD